MAWSRWDDLDITILLLWCRGRYPRRNSVENQRILVQKYDDKLQTKTILVNQLWLAMTASLGYMTTGLVRGWSSPGLPSMSELSPHLVPSEQALSWISSIPPTGALLGSLLSGLLQQRFGCKRTIIVSAPLSVLGWVGIYFSFNYEMLLVFRFLTGFSVGIVTPSAAVYVSECAFPEVRGILGSLPALFMAGGILLSYILGAWLPWNDLAITSAVCPTLLFFMMLPLPESPTWLLAHNRNTAADKALKWLHHEPRKLEVELGGPKEPQTIKTTWKEFIHPPVLIPFLMTIALLVFQQVSGIDAIIFYTVSIFKESGSKVDDHVATILVGAVQLVSNFLSLFVIDRAGRRPLLIASGALMSVAMSALGTHFYLQKIGQGDGLGLLPLLSLLVFMFGFSIGYCSIPFLLMGEMIPKKQRGVLSSIAGSLNLGFMFIVIKTYHSLKNAMGEEGTFWLYSAICLFSCFFVFFCVPETKGKTLNEIEEHFQLQHIALKQRKQQKKDAATQRKQEKKNKAESQKSTTDIKTIDIEQSHL